SKKRISQLSPIRRITAKQNLFEHSTNAARNAFSSDAQRGCKNDSASGVHHPSPGSWEAHKIYAGENPADQESGRARKEPRGDRRVDRGDRWLPASHLLKVGCQSAATYF